MSNKLARAPRRTKAFWLKHIEQWRSSGLSKAVYCRQNNLSAGNFYNWSCSKSLIGDTQVRDSRTAPLKFIPVTVADTVTKVGTVTLQSNGSMFGFPTDLSADDIERWLGAIERHHV